jgi:HEAT repeat protein
MVTVLLTLLCSLNSLFDGEAQIQDEDFNQLFVSELLRRLDDSSDEIRAKAAHALGSRRQEAKELVPALIRTLCDDKSKTVRLEAAFALGMLGPSAEKGVPALLRIAKDPKSGIRPRAVWALGAIGPPAKEAIPFLMNAVKNKDASDQENFGGLTLRQAAACALGKMGSLAEPAIPVLLESLNNLDDWQFVATVVDTLGHLRKRPEVVVPALQGLIENKKLILVHGPAARALGSYGPAAKETLPILVRALDVSSVQNKELASYIIECVLLALGEFGKDAKPAVPAIIEIFSNQEAPRVHRLKALGTLENLGPIAKGALPRLKEGLLDPQNRVYARHIFRCLTTMGEDGVPVLLTALEAPALGYQIEIIQTLGSMGTIAISAAPSLQMIAKGGDPMLAQEAAKALKKIQLQ